MVFFGSANLFLLTTDFVEFLSYEFLSHIGARFVFLIVFILSIEIFVRLLGLTHFMKTRQVDLDGLCGHFLDYQVLEE